jgi:hypothetical protein
LKIYFGFLKPKVEKNGFCYPYASDSPSLTLMQGKKNKNSIRNTKVLIHVGKWSDSDFTVDGAGFTSYKIGKHDTLDRIFNAFCKKRNLVREEVTFTSGSSDLSDTMTPNAHLGLIPRTGIYLYCRNNVSPTI